MKRKEGKRPKKITSCLWFDDQAEEAANFYVSLFDDSEIGMITNYVEAGQEIHGKEAGSVMTVDFELAGTKFVALNGGPHFTFTPAISFFVVCETETEVEHLWEKLSEGGKPLMKLGEYGWSKKYGWVEDRYGLSWQLSLGKLEDVGQKITPSLMFVSEEGQAEEAINLYTSLFEDSDITGILRYGEGEEQPEGSVKHAQFRLNGETFMAMDSSPKHADFTFNEAISLVIECDSQEEVDHFWSTLTKGGDPKAQQCGWLKDRFGVSWQVTPSELHKMLLDPDAEKVARVTDAFMQMKKLDLRQLREVYTTK
ncbi:VOC family protein [Aliifodinibius sp. S!AR15-10]|uniref:VOC family protein n=1 Tax=Aliifodinibius sp. S!AR15-10 TaxID=2950437 RepID=UPI002856A2F2|nr:VOC family protein [Aliifodinibius sp. S!AR15-10]MDR8393730.1 VOC family protein [Aliifodinibius sp. S!AR15-10]